MARVGLILLAFLMVSSSAHAQDAPRTFDWKPSIAAAVGMSLDTVSTHRFINNGSGCTESTAVFTQPPFSPDRPNFRRMWAYDVIGIAGVIGVNAAAHRAVTHAPNSRGARIFSHLAKGFGYGAGTWRGTAGARNIARCGW